MGQLEDMDAFVRIVEAGGIGRAADQMGIAKSAVSRRLVELEGRLGVQLLTRTTRSASLTEAGQTYYRRALEVLDDVTELNAQTSGAAAALHGVMRIAVPLSFGLAHLTPAVTDFVELHPDLHIHLDFADRQVDLVEDGFDLAIRIANLPDSSLIARKLTPIRHVLCASPDYLARAGRPQTPSELRSHQGLHYAHTPRSTWTFRSPQGRTVNVAAPARLTASNGEFLRDAAIAGLGIVVLPTFLAWRAIAAGALVPILADHAIPDVHAYAVYPQARHVPRRVRAIIDFLADRFGGEPYWDQATEVESP